ncbi:hypothetical protein ENSA5_19480 [Enhygromyxa salina]|uniref:Uncharacterized protein n=1 Tax=Enhygromyxa salina TaxID=215803 RepID=A0A2S9YD27_9BACT|nr:MYXO-CTERM sorting domain-containing protein [Enhygromyxa salina]PRQ03009.1 hypothetical protein ENSA5_19480 [Enhygromyxa salina]
MVPRPLVPVVVITLLTLAPSAHASELRFSTTTKGGIVSTGNTLGLAMQAGANGPGTRDSIGTFLSPDDQLVDDLPQNLGNPWFAGTTADWTLNGSSAVLDLPETSSGIEILYAELVWGGSYLYGEEDVSAALNVPVTLASDGESYEAVPALATAVTLAEPGEGFPLHYYMRSAEVTEFIAAQLSGTYTVTGVPATQDESVETLNAAGWSLVVVYGSSEASTRNLSVFVGGQFVDEDATEDYAVSGFCTPPQGTVEGAVVISALEGDAHRDGDTLQIAPTADDPFAPLSGPNNPVDNFFASQINGSEGTLDTLGSAGDLNHDAFSGTNVVGGRQGWDVTTLALSSAAGQLDNGQQSAVLRAVTSDDSFMPVLAAFEIDVSSPDFESSTAVEVAPMSIGLGEHSSLTFKLLNDGEVSASALSLTAPLGQGLELISFAIDEVPGDANQQPVNAIDLASGVEIGDIAAGTGLEVTMVVEAVGPPPAPDGWFVGATWAYDYVTCLGEDPLSAYSFAFANVGFVGGDEGGDDDGDDDGDEGGDGSGDGDDDGSGDGDDSGEGDGGGDSGDDDGGTDGGESADGGGTEGGFGGDGFGAGRGEVEGCSCQSSGSGPPAATFALLGLLGLLRRRSGS